MKDVKGEELVKLETKLTKERSAGYVSELRGLDKKELEFKLLELAKHNQEIVTTRNNDDEYQLAKEMVKELNAPYCEQLNGNKTLSRFIHLLIKDMFGEL